jgi:DNA/RNA-binding domain of Phe-tRNA-synthetase-like protein
MQPPPFAVHRELAGWELLWARLAVVPHPLKVLATLRGETADRARAALSLGVLSAHPRVAAVRRLFWAAGCDPTRYRPSSEALLRRVLKGEELPEIHPLVDLNNCLSATLAVPSSTAAEGTFTPPVTLRAGRAGESFESLRGPLGLEGKPLLADAAGPFGTPISDGRRIRIDEATSRAWLIVYLPAGVVTAGEARQALEDLLARAPMADLELVAS